MIELFTLSVTANALQADINWKLAFLRPKFRNFKIFR